VSLAKIPSERVEGLVLSPEGIEEEASEEEPGSSVTANRYEGTAELVAGTLRSDVRIYGSSGQIVAMMQATESRHLYNFAACFQPLRCLTTSGRCVWVEQKISNELYSRLKIIMCKGQSA